MDARTLPRLLRASLPARWNLSLIVGCAILFIFLIAAAFAGFVNHAARTPNYGLILHGPSQHHIFGTDELGRDIFARVVAGARVSLGVAAAAIGVAACVGIPVGLVIGYRGGVLDATVSRVVDALFAFPAILMALLILTALGPSEKSLILALGIVQVAQFVRITRAAVVGERANDYLASSRVLGSPTRFILFRALLPNIMGPLVVLLSVGLSYTILNEAALSFLGLGAAPPTAEWGVMLSEAQDHLQESPWYAIAPGACIFLVVLGLNFIGEGVQHVLDPRRNLRRRPLASSIDIAFELMSDTAEAP